MEASAITIASIIENVTSILTGVTSWITSVLGVITGNPLMLFFILLAVVPLVIGLTFKFLRRRKGI